MLFTFAFEIAYASSVYSQTKVFTMQSAGKTVLQVFKEIEKNSEFIIFYRDGVDRKSTRLYYRFLRR